MLTCTAPLHIVIVEHGILMIRMTCWQSNPVHPVWMQLQGHAGPSTLRLKKHSSLHFASTLAVLLSLMVPMPCNLNRIAVPEQGSCLARPLLPTQQRRSHSPQNRHEFIHCKAKRHPSHREAPFLNQGGCQSEWEQASAPVATGTGILLHCRKPMNSL